MRQRAVRWANVLVLDGTILWSNISLPSATVWLDSPPVSPLYKVWSGAQVGPAGRIDAANGPTGPPRDNL